MEYEVETISKESLIELFNAKNETPRIEAVRYFAKSGKPAMSLGKVANRAFEKLKHRYLDLGFFRRRGMAFVFNQALVPEDFLEQFERRSYKHKPMTEAIKEKIRRCSKAQWAKAKRQGLTRLEKLRE